MWNIVKAPKKVFNIFKAYIFYPWIVCPDSDFYTFIRYFFSFEVDEKEVTHIVTVGTIAASTSES